MEDAVTHGPLLLVRLAAFDEERADVRHTGTRVQIDRSASEFRVFLCDDLMQSPQACLRHVELPRAPRKPLRLACDPDYASASGHPRGSERLRQVQGPSVAKRLRLLPAAASLEGWSVEGPAVDQAVRRLLASLQLLQQPPE